MLASLLLLLAAYQKPNPPTAPPPLTFKIVAEKKRFHQEEPVALQLILENPGKAPVLVDQRFLPGMDESFQNEITLLVSGPREELYPFLLMRQPSRIQEEDLQTVPPGKSVEQTVTISDLYPLREPGVYRVQAIYNTENLKANFPFWRGRIVSSPITFTLEEGK